MMEYPNQTQIELKVYKRGNVAVVEMHGSDNRLNVMFADKWMAALDLIESWSDVLAMVSTGTGRFYSNGIDLEYVSQATQDEINIYRKKTAELQFRILTFPMVTIAAINGHCFAGGVIFALSHDYRIMQTGKGWMCLNEVDINMRFPNFPLLLFNAKLNHAHMNRLVVFGERLTAEKALGVEIIDRVSPQGQVLEHAVKMAEELTAKRTYTRQSISNMKKDLYRSILEDDPNIPAKL